MKLTLTMNGFTYSAESEGDDHNVEEMVYQMRGLLVSAGYHPSSVDQYFQEGEYVWGLGNEDTAPNLASQGNEVDLHFVNYDLIDKLYDDAPNKFINENDSK